MWRPRCLYSFAWSSWLDWTRFTQNVRRVRNMFRCQKSSTAIVLVDTAIKLESRNQDDNSDGFLQGNFSRRTSNSWIVSTTALTISFALFTSDSLSREVFVMISGGHLSAFVSYASPMNQSRFPDIFRILLCFTNLLGFPGWVHDTTCYNDVLDWQQVAYIPHHIGTTAERPCYQTTRTTLPQQFRRGLVERWQPYSSPYEQKQDLLVIW